MWPPEHPEQGGRSIPALSRSLHQLVKCHCPAGALPQNTAFGADSQHWLGLEPGECGQTCLCVAETARWWRPGCGVRPGRGQGWGHSHGAPRRQRVSSGSGRGFSAYRHAAVYHPASLPGRHEMWYGGGINTAPAWGWAAFPVMGFPILSPSAFSAWWILMEGNKRLQKSLSLPGCPRLPCALAALLGQAGMRRERERGGRDGGKGGCPHGCSAPVGWWDRIRTPPHPCSSFPVALEAAGLKCMGMRTAPA